MPTRALSLLAVAAATLATVAVTALASVTVAAQAQATPSSTVVLNEVYGGGGNSGATLKNDFIELASRSGSTQSVDGWSVQYLSAKPSSSSRWGVTALSGSIAAGGLYLIGEAAGSGGTENLPPTRVGGSLNLSGTSGTVALVRSTTALTCQTAADCAADTDIVDLVGYGSAVVHEGSADAPGLSNTTSAQRTSGADTDQNGADWLAAAPTPGAANGSGGSGGGGTPEPGPLRIHDIQGAGWLSPLAGDTVTNVPGVVTGVRTSGSRGYWIQDPHPDSNPATSEGLFVYTGSAPTVAAGDSVLVSGKVSDYYPLSYGETVSNTSNLSVTEISNSSAIVLSHDNPLPAPIVLTPSTVPDVYAPDLGGANTEKTPVTPGRSALDYFESIEGMRVEVDNARVVGPSNAYGEQFITTKPTQAVTVRGGTELLGDNRIPSGRLEVVPADGSDPHVNVDDVLSGATIGPVDYSQYGGYLIAATTMGTVVPGGLRPTVAKRAPAKQLSIATYNVENLAPGDPGSKYAALAKGIVTDLASPDIVALEEVQDNTGAVDDGVVDANQTIDKLTAAIVAAGGPSYGYRQINPVNDRDGGQPGGNIRVVFLFNPARVSFADAGPSSVNRSTTGTQVVKRHGKPALTLSPGRIDPTNPVWSDSRKPLVGEFRFRGKDVFVIANHWNSKGGDQNAAGRFQYPDQTSRVQRSGQAAVVHRFVSGLLAVDKKADVVVAGDLNDYQFSPPLTILRTGDAAGTGTPILTDLIDTLPVDQQYTYVYDGVSQVLDHILTSRGTRVRSYEVVHINSEFRDQTSDHDPQLVRIAA